MCCTVFHFSSRMTKRLAEFDDQLQKGNAANLERAAAASSSSDTSQKVDVVLSYFKLSFL